MNFVSKWIILIVAETIFSAHITWAHLYPHYFECKNGELIPILFKCDGRNDCRDQSDETEATCARPHVHFWSLLGLHMCFEGEFKCRTSFLCIPQYYVCNGQNNCGDGSDETHCERYKECDSDQFKCNTGECIHLRSKCDGRNDCADGSDEQNCCRASPCENETHFTCHDGQCISKSRECDGIEDCAHGEDERNCTERKQPQCGENQFQCNYGGKCINNTNVCDLNRDCPYGEDEEQCFCGKDEFQCTDKWCIPASSVCSGQPDCLDGSDEIGCNITLVLRAQGCDPQQFDCGDSNCIPYSKVCDGQTDCPGGQDEMAAHCGQNECMAGNGGCDHVCVDTLDAFYCDCRKGYELVNGSTCVDIDECKIPGHCSQMCTNSRGSYTCACAKGYSIDPNDPKKCIATIRGASLLFTGGGNIFQTNLDASSGMTAIVNDTDLAVALDFEFKTRTLFWSDEAEKKLYKAPMDRIDERTEIGNFREISSEGLAIDWIYGHIYFSDLETYTIDVMNLDGTMRHTLIDNLVDYPRAIALDPIDGWIFWTDWGRKSHIGRAGLDGSHQQIIVDQDITWPNGITLDFVLKQLYWIDARSHTLSSCNYDGSNRRQILQSTSYLGHPFSISTFEDSVYWTDWDRDTVFGANKFDGKGVRPMTKERLSAHPMTVHVFHANRQPNNINYCTRSNRFCSHLCLPSPRLSENGPKYSCVCPAKMHLADDDHTCIKIGNGTRRRI